MRRLRLVLVTLLALLGLAGCSLGSQGIYDVPLPGGPDVGGNGYQVTAQFTDALDLVPQAAVKVDDVAVGKVTSITLRADGRAAVVTMQVGGGVELPGNATARITQTSLLGEKFVSLDRPSTGATGSLRSSRTIGLEGTSEAVDAERVFGAMSLLLNGGGLQQFQEISRELAAVSTGRDDEIRAFLTNVSQFVTTLNTRKQAITDALDSLDRLGKTLDDNTTKLTTALDQLPPGLKVLADQRTQLVAMLTALDSLSKVTVTTLDQSKDDFVADLNRLQPILTQLAASGQALPDALQILFTFPFPDSVLGAVKGDYVNAFLVTNFATTGTTIPATSGDAGWPAAYPGSVGTPPAPSGAGPAQIGPPPMMLPSTSSAAPGLPTSTITTSLPTTPIEPDEPVEPDGHRHLDRHPDGHGHPDRPDHGDAAHRHRRTGQPTTPSTSATSPTTPTTPTTTRTRTPNRTPTSTRTGGRS